MEKVLIFACLTWASLTFNTCYAQNPEQYLPTFNIARDKEVTVNATCGGDLGGQTETYCKLVGYDSFFVKSSNQILSGQVKIHSGVRPLSSRECVRNLHLRVQVQLWAHATYS